MKNWKIKKKKKTEYVRHESPLETSGSSIRWTGSRFRRYCCSYEIPAPHTETTADTDSPCRFRSWKSSHPDYGTACDYCWPAPTAARRAPVSSSKSVTFSGTTSAVFDGPSPRRNSWAWRRRSATPRRPLWGRRWKWRPRHGNFHHGSWWMNLHLFRRKMVVVGGGYCRVGRGRSGAPSVSCGGLWYRWRLIFGLVVV